MELLPVVIFLFFILWLITNDVRSSNRRDRGDREVEAFKNNFFITKALISAGVPPERIKVDSRGFPTIWPLRPDEFPIPPLPLLPGESLWGDVRPDLKGKFFLHTRESYRSNAWTERGIFDTPDEAERELDSIMRNKSQYMAYISNDKGEVLRKRIK